jgi:hypothetical protein
MHGTNAYGSSRSRRLRGLLEEGQRAHDAHRRRLLSPRPSGVSLTTTVFGVFDELSVLSVLVDVEARGLHLAHALGLGFGFDLLHLELTPEWRPPDG